MVNSQFAHKSVKEALRRNVEMVIAYPGLNVTGLGKDVGVRTASDVINLPFLLATSHPGKV